MTRLGADFRDAGHFARAARPCAEVLLAVSLVIAFGVFGHAAGEAGVTQGPRADRAALPAASGRSYVLIFSFITQRYFPKNDSMGEWIALLNASPYDGTAVWLRDAYDARPLPSWEETEPLLRRFKETCKKDLWFTVYLNWLIEHDPQHSSQHAQSQQVLDYSSRPRGMDLDGRAGNLADFMEHLTIALRSARYLGAPGIIVDPEAYNNHAMYRLEDLAARREESVAEARRELEALGRRMGEIVEKEYPDAVMLFLFIEPGLTTENIARGLLDHLRERGLGARVIEGGESRRSLGYVNSTLDALREKMARRTRLYSDLLARYPDNFMLGGTIALADTPERRTGWIKEQYEKSPIRSVEDLIPHLEVLFASYPYVWVYAAGAADYLPYEPDKAKRFDDAVRRALESVRSTREETAK